MQIIMAAPLLYWIPQQEEVAPSEAEAAPVEAVPVPSDVPVVEEPVVAPVVETNGTSEAVPETNGNGVSEVVEPVIESEKRKSLEVVGGEGDGPDSTDAAVVKKAKVDESEVSAEEAVPVVEASV